MRLLLLSISIIICLCAKEVKGQVYPFRTYGTEHGLNHARINAIVQDKDGYIWVATAVGVSKTDGRIFTNFTTKNGLAGDKVTSLAVDKQNRIWVGHQGTGISVISKDTIYTITERDGLVNNEVNALHCAQDGSIWAGTFDGLTVFSEDTTLSYTSDDGLAADNIRSLASDASGAIWIGTFGSGICHYRDGRFSSFSFDDSLVNNHITALHQKGNDMLIATMAGAYRYDGQKVSTLLSAIGQVNALTHQDDAIWTGSFDGLARVLQDATLFIHDYNGLAANEVLSLFTDREGNVWVGTTKGLVRIHHLALSHYPVEGGQALEPNGLFKDSKGRLWAANSLGGVMRKENNVMVRAFADPDINEHIIGPIAEAPDGSLWFGTRDFSGLFQWDGKRIYNHSDALGLVDNNINCLHSGKNGGMLIGTPSGLSQLIDGEFTTVAMLEDPGTAHITSMLHLNDGRVIIGSLDGSVSIFWDGEVEPWYKGNEIGAPVNHLSEGPHGICVATEGNGLFILKENTLRHFGLGSGLPDLNVRSTMTMGIDLYAGTSSGIFRLAVGDSTLTVQSIVNRNSGAVMDCRAGSLLKDGSSLWFGTSKGMIRLQTRELRKYAEPPALFLNELQLFYHPVNWAERKFATDSMGLPARLILSHSDNYLRFHFTALSLSDPGNVRYRWMLEGFETEWTPLTSIGMANYPNLPPGTYTFKVIACTGDDVCVSKPISFRFRISPPFWQTIWFYILVAVAVFSGAYAYISWRERKLKKEKRLLEATVEERTRELREQKEIVEDQNSHILESIDYARNIQMAVLPSDDEMKRAFAAHFVLYRPKETVGGDFYWIYTHKEVTWAAAIDCTGHGVAGAFMSMIGTDLLNQIIIEKEATDVAQVLEAMDKGIKLAFAQSATEFEGDKGMDLCLVRIDRAKQQVAFAGAQRPLYYTLNHEVAELEGDSISISCNVKHDKKFVAQQIALVPGMRLFLFSDGYADQFGGAKGKKFMTRQLKEIIHSCIDRPMPEQHAALELALDAWRGSEYPQLDDILLMGLQL